MEDRLREIEGTLARTSERKNTILYKLAKRKSQEERLARLGIKKLPTNPRAVSDPKVAHYALSQLKQEVGDKIAKIRNDTLVNVERDGEAVVRAKNDEINKLLAQRDQWERRLCELTGKEWDPRRSRKRAYFGCAKQLPEAVEAATKEAGTKRSREGRDSADENRSGTDTDTPTSESNTSAIPSDADEGDATEFPASGAVRHSYADAVAQLGSRDADASLLEEEKLAERAFREAHPFDPTFLAQFRQPSSSETDSYVSQIRNLRIPEEAELAKNAVLRRKMLLQEKLVSLRAEKHLH